MTNSSVRRKLLRVNLSSQKWTDEKIDDSVINLFIGGRALGAYYLNSEVDPNIDPLSPDNKLIFFAGPLAGTMAPTSARFNVSTLSPLTDIYLFSICSGFFANALKSCGYDGLIVEGKAPGPVVLVVSGKEIRLEPADKLWGKDSFSTQALIKQQFERNKSLEVACIGPGGENLSRMACIMSGTRAAGRGGPGAVMGSKNLKAIAVEGSEEIQVSDPDRFMHTLNEIYGNVKNTPFLLDGMGRYGSAISMGITSKFGIVPCNNWRATSFSGLDGLQPEAMREQVVKDLACPTCPIGCSKIARADQQSYPGVMTDGPEYETLYSLGSACNIGSLDAVIAGDILCDKLGLDTISAGVTAAFAMECAEKGLLPQKYQNARLQFGDSESMLGLINKMAYRKDVGEIMTDGCRRAAEIVGQDSSHFAMHAKGMELGGYDPRGVKGQALVLACGPRGGCHHAGGYVIAMEIKGEDRFAFLGKGRMVKQARDFRAFLDSAIYCAFLGVAMDIELGSKLVTNAIGFDFTEEDAWALGDRCSCLERVFNNRAGISREEDTLPPRILHESLAEGPSAGHKMADELEPMKDEFYQQCGWDEKGLPTDEKLSSLGLKT